MEEQNHGAEAWSQKMFMCRGNCHLGNCNLQDWPTYSVPCVWHSLLFFKVP